MAKVKTEPKARRIRPAISPEAREKQLMSLAMDQAEQQLMDGTASSQVITYFLKLASQRERLERERLEEENKLLRAKTDALEAQKNSETDYARVIEALRRYSGRGDDDNGY